MSRRTRFNPTLTRTDSPPAPVLVPGASRTWRKAVARVRSGGADAKLLCVGDSTTGGYGASGITQGVPLSYPYQLAGILNSYIPSASGLGIPSPSTGAADARWTLGTGWASYPGYGWGKNGAFRWQTPTVGNLVYTPNVLADRYDVYYLSNTGLGTLTITATGGSAVVQDTSGAAVVNKVTVNAGSASASNTVTLVPSIGQCIVVGIEPWLSTTSKVRVGNAGVSGTLASGDWHYAATWNSATCIQAHAPDLTIISLGINDATAAVTPANYTTAVNAMITAARVSGDVILMPPVPCRSTAAANTIANIPIYTGIMAGLGYPVVDLAGRWGSGDTANTYGLMYDALHPNALGYADIAAMLVPELLP